MRPSPSRQHSCRTHVRPHASPSYTLRSQSQSPWPPVICSANNVFVARRSFSYHGHSPSQRIVSSTMIHVLLHWTRLLSLSAEYVTSFLSLRTLRPDCRHRTWSFLTCFGLEGNHAYSQHRLTISYAPIYVAPRLCPLSGLRSAVT